MDIEKDFFEHDITGGNPVYTLAECQAASRWEDENGGVLERFRKALYLCDAERLNFLGMAAELTEKRTAWRDLAYQPFGLFCRNGFVFLFEQEGEFHLVLPLELIQIYRKVVAEPDFAPVNSRKIELAKYASALVEMCGAYEIDWFVEVWNKHNKEKIERAEAEQFLDDLMNFNSDYFIEGGFVVHNVLEFEEDFDVLFEETNELPYFMPTKSVIKMHYDKRHDYDYKIPEQKEMDDFLARNFKGTDKAALRDLDTLQLDIEDSCLRLQSPGYVLDVLTTYDMPVKSPEFVRDFERLYNRLRDNTHIWELRGHTPRLFEAATGKRLKRFALPQS